MSVSSTVKFGALSSVILFIYIYESSCARVPCDFNSEVLRGEIQKYLPTFAKGVPDIGVQSIDPLVVENLNLSLSSDLRIHIKQGSATGFRKCKVESVCLKSDTLETQFVCNITMRGHYQSVGRLLAFPINGDGDSVIRCKNLKIVNVLKLKTVVKANNMRHLEIQSTNTQHFYEGRVMYKLTNLFRNSPITSKIVVDFMNQNWRLVAEEFGDPLLQFGSDSIIGRLRTLFDAVPVDRLVSFPISF